MTTMVINKKRNQVTVWSMRISDVLQSDTHLPSFGIKSCCCGSNTYSNKNIIVLYIHITLDQWNWIFKGQCCQCEWKLSRHKIIAYAPRHDLCNPTCSLVYGRCCWKIRSYRINGESLNQNRVDMVINWSYDWSEPERVSGRHLVSCLEAAEVAFDVSSSFIRPVGVV